MPQTVLELGQKVKAKYPGQYDDMADDEVGRRVKLKFPGAYDDFADVQAGPSSELIQQRRAESEATAKANAPSLLGGFLSEAKKNALKVGGIMMNTAPEAQTMGYRENPASALLAAASPSKLTTAASIPEMIKGSPAGEMMQSAGNAVSGAVKAFMDKPREPVKAMTQALKPLATNNQFSSSVERALPHVKAAEQELGKPIEGVQDLLDATKLAKQGIWKQYEQILGPQAARGVDASGVADAIDRSVPLKLKVQNPEAVEKLKAIADTYRGRTFSIAELDNMLTTSNAELASYYAKYPAAQRAAEAANPDIAQNVAEAGALRKLIYGQLDQGGTAADLKKTYGSLMNLEKEGQRRLNVAARQNPDSLSEQIGKWSAAGGVAKAAVKAATGRPFAAASDLASAYAGRQVASGLKQANSADALIANVFKNYSQPAPSFATAMRPPAGLLEAGPVVTPQAADTSFVKGVSADLAQRQVKGALPPYREPIVTPAPEVADASYVKGTPARLGSPVMSAASGRAIGAGLPKETHRDLDMIKSRLDEFRDLVRSGATEMTGKAIREEGGAVVGRHGGGMKIMFPEFKDFPESPGQISAAIANKSGALYQRVLKAVSDSLGTPVQLEDTYFGPADNPARSKVFDAIRERFALSK